MQIGTEAASLTNISAYSRELQDLLLAGNSDEQRQCLLRSFNRLQVAGYCRFSYTLEGDVRASIRVRRLEDLSGAIAGVPTTEVVSAMLASTPAWLTRWMLRRREPFWLHRFTRFIPYSSQVVLRASAPPGRRPLGDFLIVTTMQQMQGEALMIGLLKPARQQQFDQLVTIASAYLLKDPMVAEAPIGDSTFAHVAGALNPRQIECLRWMVAGKSLEEVATITEMSYSNVRYHLDRAKKQTGMASLQQLLAFAAVEYRMSPYGPEQGLDVPAER